MKKTFQLNINNLHNTPDGCWFYKNKRYTYIHSKNTQGVSLPTIEPEFIPVLKKHNIPFKKLRNGKVIYWDPENDGMVSVNLPVYIDDGDSYIFSATYHTGNIFTEDSVTAANKLRDEIVEPEVTMRKLKKVLSGRKAAGTVGYLNLPFKEDHIFTSDDGTRIEVLPVKRISRETGTKIPKKSAYVVFDVNQIELNSNVKVRVPANSANLFKGTAGWQADYWCKKLGLKKIRFVEI